MKKIGVLCLLSSLSFASDVSAFGAMEQHDMSKMHEMRGKFGGDRKAMMAHMSAKTGRSQAELQENMQKKRGMMQKRMQEMMPVIEQAVVAAGGNLSVFKQHLQQGMMQHMSKKTGMSREQIMQKMQQKSGKSMEELKAMRARGARPEEFPRGFGGFKRHKGMPAA